MRYFFIHGAGCTGEVFRSQLEAFPDAYATTLPGRGDGGAPATIGDFADSVARELCDLRFGETILCGSSLGGAVALELALRAGDSQPRTAWALRGIVLLGSGAKLRVAPVLFEQIERDFPAAARSLAAMFFADATAERIDAAVHLMLCVGQAQTLRDFRACDAFDATRRITALRSPLLALTGEGDVLTPPKFALFLADRIPGASARILSGAGHLAMIERPDETNAALHAFVNQIENR